MKKRYSVDIRISAKPRDPRPIDHLLNAINTNERRRMPVGKQLTFDNASLIIRQIRRELRVKAHDSSIFSDDILMQEKDVKTVTLALCHLGGGWFTYGPMNRDIRCCTVGIL